MANTQHVEPTVRQILCNVMGKSPEQVTPNAKLVADLDMQSIDFIELYEALDQAFNVDMDDGATGIQSVGDLVQYIESRLERDEGAVRGCLAEE